MAVIQRPTKGARISSFYPVHELPPLASLDSAFQLQEYISLLIRLNVHDVESIVSIPGKSSSHERDSSDGSNESAEKEGKGEVTVDESCWIYEQLRRLAQDLSHPLITTLQQECTRQTCPEMKAGEWLYLCVAHGNEGAMEQCCAIDYILHTLDSATALLNSPRAFPSRLSIPPASTRHFSSLARRLGRIFAHAYYHHREAFEQAEAESSLYARFLALTSRFNLVPSEFLVIPPRMTIHTSVHEEEDEREPEEPSDEGTQEHPEYNGGDHMSTARRISSQDRRWLQSELIARVERDGSPPGPADDARNPSPRKGRSRTDTMVYSEAVNVAEELAKGQGLSEAELDQAIAHERMLVATEPIAVEEPSEESVAPLTVPVEEPAAEVQPETPQEETPGEEVAEEIAPVEPEGAPSHSDAPGDEEPSPVDAQVEVEDEKVEEEEPVQEEEPSTTEPVEPEQEAIEQEVDVTEASEPAEATEELEESAAGEEAESDIAAPAGEATPEAEGEAEEAVSAEKGDEEEDKAEEHPSYADVAAVEPHAESEADASHAKPTEEESAES